MSNARETQKRTASLRINNLLMESKTHGGTAEDNGILTKQLVLLQNIRKEKIYFTRAQD